MKINQIQEALPISVAKKYVQAWDPNFHKQVFDRQSRKDKNAYRIYIPFEQESDRKIVIPQNLLDYLQSAIPGKPYTTDADNYMQGLAFEVANPNRKLGIGKMLARSEGGEKDLTRKTDLQAIKKAFDADPQRAATRKADKLIVFSRHPYDVAGMSTDRGWRSCMNLVDGINRHYVLRDVKQGSIIAYLINADDLNVRKPLARILIKPYQEKGNPKNLVMMGDAVYGTAPDNFKNLVDAWVNKNYNEGKGGLFCLAKGLYRDVIPQQIQILGDEQIKQMPVANLVSAAIKDHKLWPRVAQLRPDADEIFWRVAERDDTRAARLIKQIDLTRFKTAITKKGQIMARLHTQTPEMVQMALDVDPTYVKFVRNRTPAQHAIVLNLVKKNPSSIKSVHEPTPEQIQLALKKDDWLWNWVMKNHPEALSKEQIVGYILHSAEDYDMDDTVMNWIKNNHPDLFQNPKVFRALALFAPDWLWNNLKLSDADVIQMILAQSKPTGWDEGWIERQADTIIRRLKQVDRALVDDKLISHVQRVAPWLLAAFPQAVDKQELLKLVRKTPAILNLWPDPDADMVYVALKHDRDEQLERSFLEAKYDPVWLKLIEQDPTSIFRRQTAPDSMVRLATLHPKLARHDAYSLLKQYDLNVGTQVMLLKRYPTLIEYIPKPSLAAQMAAVNANPDVYDRIRPKDRHPAVKAYMAAYRAEMRKPE